MERAVDAEHKTLGAKQPETGIGEATRELILDAAYVGNIHVADRTIDSHVRNIRAKMAVAGCESVIETVHGVGFKLGRCEAAH